MKWGSGWRGWRIP